MFLGNRHACSKGKEHDFCSLISSSCLFFGDYACRVITFITAMTKQSGHHSSLNVASNRTVFIPSIKVYKKNFLLASKFSDLFIEMLDCKSQVVGTCHVLRLKTP